MGGLRREEENGELLRKDEETGHREKIQDAAQSIGGDQVANILAQQTVVGSYLAIWYLKWQ